jgi:SAM-dependent methyltransferase
MDFTQVTEAPGNRITRESFSMICTRYAYAASLCGGKRVLEVACGAGQGLGHLASHARQVVGGDYTEGLLQTARHHYGNRVPLVKLDAQSLPFHDRVFDLLILFEAIYYLAKPAAFLAESRRVLRDGGLVLICTVNREWSDFNPSPHSHRYFSAHELATLLAEHGFSAELYGAFPVVRATVPDRVVSLIKCVAVSLHLIPKTMKGKEFLKRLFLGKLVTMPPELLPEMGETLPLTRLDGASASSEFKVLYAIGRLT